MGVGKIITCVIFKNYNTYFTLGFQKYVIFHFQTVFGRRHTRLGDCFVAINNSERSERIVRLRNQKSLQRTFCWRRSAESSVYAKHRHRSWSQQPRAPTVQRIPVENSYNLLFTTGPPGTVRIAALAELWPLHGHTWPHVYGVLL